MAALKTIKSVLLATAVVITPVAAAPAFAFQAPQLQSFAPLVEAVKPAVVTVVTRAAAPEMVPSGLTTPEQLPEPFRDFFERFGMPGMPGQPGLPGEGPQARRMPQQGLGSGFVVDPSGVIVTNNHVVDGAEEITVILGDGTEYEAELVGTDDRVDIAVLRIDAKEPLPTVEWGDSDAVRVGDWAVAIGNPLGLDGTVTAGIVSARGRDINSGPYDDYLQVDAAINRGNSGGPLFDLEGKVIGVNTAILSPSGGNIGLGFAIPAEQAQDIVADLLEDGQVERGWIGVSIQPVTDDIAESLGLEDATGALVAEVTPDSPAEKAGLRAGDVILGFAEAKVAELRDLTRAVADAVIGEETGIEVWRDGERVTLSIAPDLLSADASAPARPGAPVEVPELGLALTTGDQGVTVAGVETGSPADEAGLRAGDVILSVNQTVVDAPAIVSQAVEAAREDGRNSVLVLVEREGMRRFVTLETGLA